MLILSTYGSAFSYVVFDQKLSTTEPVPIVLVILVSHVLYKLFELRFTCVSCLLGCGLISLVFLRLLLLCVRLPFL